MKNYVKFQINKRDKVHAGIMKYRLGMQRLTSLCEILDNKSPMYRVDEEINCKKCLDRMK